MHHLPEMALVMPFLNRLPLQALALPQACSAAPALQAQHKTKNIIPSSLQQTLHVVLNTTTSLIPCIHATHSPTNFSMDMDLCQGCIQFAIFGALIHVFMLCS
jgi:hypothetical protein